MDHFLEDRRGKSYSAPAYTYAVKLTGWHGNTMLGFDMQLDDELETVTITAQAAIDSVRARLFTKDNLTITPRHIVTENVFKDCPGEVPSVGDPSRASFLERQELTRSVLGVGIWMNNAYPQCASAINAMCMNMANPGDECLGQLRHMFMHLGEKPPGKTFGAGPVLRTVVVSVRCVSPLCDPVDRVGLPLTCWLERTRGTRSAIFRQTSRQSGAVTHRVVLRCRPLKG